MPAKAMLKYWICLEEFKKILSVTLKRCNISSYKPGQMHNKLIRHPALVRFVEKNSPFGGVGSYIFSESELVGKIEAT
jgi:hypothetical protein